MNRDSLGWFGVLLLAGVLGAACGDGGSEQADSGGAGSGGSSAAPASEMVSAQDGGEVTTRGAALKVPGGALDDDTEITIETVDSAGLPDASDLASSVYEFGPDGTTFSEPVELSLELEGDVPDGMQARIAWLDEEADRWVPLTDSRIEAGQVIASTDHFTKFAIVLTAAGQTAGSCEELDFKACGGDLTGEWEFSLSCADFDVDDVFGSDDPFGQCPGLEAEASIDLGGSVTFGADGRYRTQMTVESSFVLTVPTSCLMGADCSQLADDGGSAMVSGDVCQLMSADEPETDTSEGRYELDGNSVTTIEDGEEPDAAAEYCVEGDVLTVRTVEVEEDTGAETVLYYQALRK